MSSDEELDLQPKPKRQKRFKFKTFEERVADVSARGRRCPVVPHDLRPMHPVRE